MTELSAGLWGAAGVIIAALCALLGVWLTNRREGRKSNVDVAQRLIDQFQEELAKRDKRIDGLERRERVLLDYVSRLRFHIDQNTGPPPPDFPQSLIDGRSP